LSTLGGSLRQSVSPHDVLDIYFFLLSRHHIEDYVSSFEAVSRERGYAARNEDKRVSPFGAEEQLNGLLINQKSIQPTIVELIIILQSRLSPCNSPWIASRKYSARRLPVEIVNKLLNLRSIHSKLWIVSFVSCQKSHVEGF
jgi:hypothetical protein